MRGRKLDSRTAAAIKLLKQGEARKDIAIALGWSVGAIHNIACRFKIKASGDYRRESGAYMQAVKRFDEDKREEASFEFAWLCDAARANDGTPADADFAESGEAIGKTSAEMKELWAKSWGKFYTEREKAIRHSDRKNGIEPSSIPQLTHVELRDVEIGVAGPDVDKKIAEATAAIRERAPRDLADP